MKAYGPFVVEDVASLPVENAKILVKQGFAEVVEVS
jgi:DNA replication initiation complex subunit (GINS family)